MTWASIILAVLRLANSVLTVVQQNKWISVGEEQAIAKMGAEIARRAQISEEVWNEVRNLGEEQIDDLLRSLEPGSMSDNSRSKG